MKYFVILVLAGLVLPVYAESSDFTVANVYWEQAAFPSHDGTKATLIVTDPDMNLYPNAIDYVWVDVHSDTDASGFRMTLFETDFDSGIFQGDVTFTETPPSGRGFLHTVDGDTITAKYADTLLPANYTSIPRNAVVTEHGMDLSATAIVGASPPPLERIHASDFRLLNIQGDIISDNTILANQQVRLVTDLENQMDHSQPFAYLVLIQNSKNQAESLSWLVGNLTSSQKITSDVTWISFEEGTYYATVFVWESIDNPTALSPPLQLEINVKNEDYPFGLTGPVMNQETCNNFVISQWQPRVEDREMVQQFLEICIQREFLTTDLVERGKVADNFTTVSIQSALTSADGDIEKTIQILEEMNKK